jgi:tetratricopeptide (TPR) repeat protein
MDKDDFDSALRFFERALALEPTNVDTLDAAADACIEAGYAERAISLLLRSIELAPGVNWHK